jgi:hypothetical protein
MKQPQKQTNPNNMKTIVNQFFFFGSLLLLVASCKDEKDKTPPVIVSVSEPLQGDTLLTGNELHIEAVITDNEELSQLKIDIHGAEDGHDHGKTDGSAFWETIRIVELDGTSGDIHEHIDIPEDAGTGKYHVILTAVDEAGNQSAFIERDIYIRNTSDLINPVIQLTSPTEGAIINTGEPFVVSGLLQDNSTLSKVEIKVYRGSTLMVDKDIDLALPEHNLSESIPTTGWVPGSYKLELKLYDKVQNHAEKEVSFTVN